MINYLMIPQKLYVPADFHRVLLGEDQILRSQEEISRDERTREAENNNEVYQNSKRILNQFMPQHERIAGFLLKEINKQVQSWVAIRR